MVEVEDAGRDRSSRGGRVGASAPSEEELRLRAEFEATVLTPLRAFLGRLDNVDAAWLASLGIPAELLTRALPGTPQRRALDPGAGPARADASHGVHTPAEESSAAGKPFGDGDVDQDAAARRAPAGGFVDLVSTVGTGISRGAVTVGRSVAVGGQYTWKGLSTAGVAVWSALNHPKVAEILREYPLVWDLLDELREAVARQLREFQEAVGSDRDFARLTPEQRQRLALLLEVAWVVFQVFGVPWLAAKGGPSGRLLTLVGIAKDMLEKLMADRTPASTSTDSR